MPTENIQLITNDGTWEQVATNAISTTKAYAIANPYIAIVIVGLLILIGLVLVGKLVITIAQAVANNETNQIVPEATPVYQYREIKIATPIKKKKATKKKVVAKKLKATKKKA
jgi:hypothetical protein